MIVKQISSLEKVRSNDALDFAEVTSVKALQGERLSYQIAINISDVYKYAKVWVESSFEKNDVCLYCEKEILVDLPARVDVSDDNYIISQSGFLPDVLVPLTEQNEMVSVMGKNVLIWVKVNVPKNAKIGENFVKIHIDTIELRSTEDQISYSEIKEMKIDVIPALMPEQKLIYTRWFYADCVSDFHNVEIYSEKHWALIDKYIAAAADVGVNMMLTPIHTPPLDTEVGTRRPCVQLVDIEKKGDVYEFNFDKFKRFVDICKKNGIKYFEIAHLFSQWGADFAPNIMVKENGKIDYMFGWHVSADSEEYVSFLKQYIKAISNELEKEGIAENTYFHVSDEPHLDQIEKYERARNIIKPLIGKSKIFDALSNVEFYDKGLVECPVTSVKAIVPFLERKIEDQWAYYCCNPEKIYTNVFIAMPSARTRVLGYQLYKYDIKGFLHWGLNYYNSCCSRYNINPYVTTSADGCFPSGDGFILYPSKNGAYPSIRGEVTYQAIQDINVCLALEELIGREKVVQIIDAAAGGNLTFENYPQNTDFTEKLHAQMIEMIAQNK